MLTPRRKEGSCRKAKETRKTTDRSTEVTEAEERAGPFEAQDKLKPRSMELCPSPAESTGLKTRHYESGRGKPLPHRNRE
jgi:hypothetical protein